MFEIPDDDDNFWDEVPLDGNNNSNSLAGKENKIRPQLRVPESACSGSGAKRFCSVDILYDRDSTSTRPAQVSSTVPLNPCVTRLNSRKSSPATVTNVVQNNVSSTRGIEINQEQGTPMSRQKAIPVVSEMITPVRPVSGRSMAQRKDEPATPNTTTPNSDRTTPRRRRKFPGPAGLLPQLAPGQSLEMLSVSTTSNNTPQQHKSPQEEPALLSSQATEDVFNDVPWQTLLSDLGEDGCKIMKKFSIATTLLTAGKKQLHQGKAALIFGVIESIESHGSEASVTIKDKSGKMQGTIHRDLLKEYDVELQVGTVLVLKQVSIISLSNRKHYLNITPTNVIVLYHSKQGSLKSIKFHGSQDSLRSVLVALEKKAAAHRNSGTLTPNSHTGSSSLSMDGSGTSTPRLSVGTPSTPVLNQRLFNPGTPLSGNTGTPALNQRLFTSGTPTTSNTSLMRTPLPGVRNVSVVGMGSQDTQFQINQNKQNVPSNLRNINTNKSVASTPSNTKFRFQPNLSTPNIDNNGRESSVGSEVINQTPKASVRHDYSSGQGMRTPNVTAIGDNGNIIAKKASVQSSNSSTSNALNQICATTVESASDMPYKNTCAKIISSKTSPDSVTDVKVDIDNQQQSVSVLSNVPSKPQWRFKSPTSTPVRPPTNITPNLTRVNINSNSNFPSGRSCQLSSAERNETDISNRSNEVTPNTLTDIGIPNVAKSKWSFKSRSFGSPQITGIGQERNGGHDNQSVEEKSNPGKDDDIWEDDLSDELLSQLSDEMT